MKSQKLIYCLAAFLFSLATFIEARAQGIGSQSIRIVTAKMRPATCADFLREVDGWVNKVPITLVVPEYKPETFSVPLLPIGVYKVQGKIKFKLGALIDGTDIAVQLDSHCLK
jgi:hypothetical protein